MTELELLAHVGRMSLAELLDYIIEHPSVLIDVHKRKVGDAIRAQHQLMSRLPTEWLPATTPPVHIGWYEVEGLGMRRWDGRAWFWMHPDMGLVPANVHPEEFWRGLSTDTPTS